MHPHPETITTISQVLCDFLQEGPLKWTVYPFQLSPTVSNLQLRHRWWWQ